MASVGRDKLLVVWDLQLLLKHLRKRARSDSAQKLLKLKQTAAVQPHGREINDVDMSHDEELVATAAKDKTVKVGSWRWLTFSCVFVRLCFVLLVHNKVCRLVLCGLQMCALLSLLAWVLLRGSWSGALLAVAFFCFRPRFC